MGKTPGQQPRAPLPRVGASPSGDSCSPVRMSLPHMPPQPSVSDRLNKIRPPIELHVQQESTVAAERTSPPAPPPNRLRQEAADLSSRAMRIKQRALNQSPEIVPSRGFSFAADYLGMMRAFVREDTFDCHLTLSGLRLFVSFKLGQCADRLRISLLQLRRAVRGSCSNFWRS